MNYTVYEVNTNRNIFLTDDFDHAFNLCFQFNEEAKDNEKYDIKKERSNNAKKNIHTKRESR